MILWGKIHWNRVCLELEIERQSIQFIAPLKQYIHTGGGDDATRRRGGILNPWMKTELAQSQNYARTNTQYGSCDNPLLRKDGVLARSGYTLTLRGSPLWPARGAGPASKTRDPVKVPSYASMPAACRLVFKPGVRWPPLHQPRD